MRQRLNIVSDSGFFSSHVRPEDVDAALSSTTRWADTATYARRREHFAVRHHPDGRRIDAAAHIEPLDQHRAVELCQIDGVSATIRVV